MQRDSSTASELMVLGSLICAFLDLQPAQLKSPSCHAATLLTVFAPNMIWVSARSQLCCNSLSLQACYNSIMFFSWKLKGNLTCTTVADFSMLLFMIASPIFCRNRSSLRNLSTVVMASCDVQACLTMSETYLRLCVSAASLW